MSYIAPTTNRTSASPGYWNVSDWTRVYGNALYVRNRLDTDFNIKLPFTTIAAPTTSTDPRTIMAGINQLLVNIEIMREYVNHHGAVILSLSTLVYVIGAGGTCPNWNDVNQWESTIDQINNFLAGLITKDVLCGVATCGGDYIIDSI